MTPRRAYVLARLSLDRTLDYAVPYWSSNKTNYQGLSTSVGPLSPEHILDNLGFIVITTMGILTYFPSAYFDGTFGFSSHSEMLMFLSVTAAALSYQTCTAFSVFCNGDNAATASRGRRQSSFTFCLYAPLTAGVSTSSAFPTRAPSAMPAPTRACKRPAPWRSGEHLRHRARYRH